MKVLYVISGVTGMTGNELVRQLLNQKEDNVEIIGFDNFFASSIDTVKDCLDNNGFTFFEYDLNNKKQMEDIKELVLKSKSEFDEVIYINCAAVVHTEHFYKVYSTYETNVVGMNDFLNQAIEVGAEKYINCSTSEIYSMNSWNEDGGVKESDYITMADAEHSQRTSYATGKLLTEFFMKDAVDNGKIKGCSIRFANVYSKDEKYPKHIIPHIIDSFKNTGEVTLLENSKKNCRTFLNNYDSCSAVLELAKTDSALDGTIYNVATDEEISIIDLTKLIAEKMGITEPVIKFEGYRESDPERRLLSTEKIRTRTNWVPIVDLDKGLEECVENYTKRWIFLEKIAIITVAGISSRFNKDVPKDEMILKCLYYEDNPEDTLIYKMLEKVSYADKIVIVGGFKFDDLMDYIGEHIPEDIKDKCNLVYNNHFDDLSSGYSLYLGIEESFNMSDDIEEILFVEGDLDVDVESFENVINSENSVLTINPEPIYSNKAVVLYQNENDDFIYAFNSDHGLLSIDEPFKAIFNSGQIWKFNDMEILKTANDNFKEYLIADTNLGIIQKYFDLIENKNIDVIGFNHWVNCNTRKDYKIIKRYWRNNLWNP